MNLKFDLMIIYRKFYLQKLKLINIKYYYTIISYIDE